MNAKFARMAAVVALVGGVQASPTLAEAPSYAREGRNISFFNVPNRDPTKLDLKQPTTVAAVTLKLTRDADVLVQFTSGLAADTGEGCPCSVRAMLKANDGDPIVIKRVNIAAPAVQTVNKYEHDRQSVDGSYVFSLPRGSHKFSLIYQIVDGKSEIMEAYYSNLQAIAFVK